MPVSIDAAGLSGIRDLAQDSGDDALLDDIDEAVLARAPLIQGEDKTSALMNTGNRLDGQLCWEREGVIQARARVSDAATGRWTGLPFHRPIAQ